MPSIEEIYERALTGPYVTEREFDTRLIFTKAQALVKEYDITFDSEYIIPADRSLAKDAYNAATKLLTDVGVLCIDTSRIIKFTDEDIEGTLRVKRRKVIVGQRPNASAIIGRKPRDRTPPHICGGPCGGPLSEEYYITILESYAQEPLINSIHTGSMLTAGGKEIRAGSPLELKAARYEGLWAREALIRANRPNMPILGVMSATTLAASELADLPGGLRPTDIHEVSFLNELKTDLRLLNKVAYNLQAGNIMASCQVPMVGGIAGGPSETVLVNIATTLQGYIMGGVIHISSPIHIIYNAPSHRDCLWVSNLHNLALRESGVYLPILNYVGSVAGPCTEMAIFEIAAGTIGNILCGASGICAAATTAGAMTDYYSPLEAVIAGEIAHIASNLSLEDANTIVYELLKKYENAILDKNIPLGKRFQECYDMKTLKPKNNYLQILETGRRQLTDLGITLI
jgi:methylamine--corrinoid protein Co-methyltransferase